MANDEVRPALTAEEWSARFLDGSIHDTHAGMYPWGVRIMAQYDDSADVVGHDRHALAALCLYGQPYGFTMEDVEALTDCAGWLEDQAYGPAQRKAAEATKAIAAKIAAMLPQERV